MIRCRLSTACSGFFTAAVVSASLREEGYEVTRTSVWRRAFRLFAVSAVLALVAQLQLATPAGAVGPTLQVSPKLGPPTQAVTITGAGFASGQPIAVTFDQAPAVTTSSNATGGFAVPYSIPASALPGNHRFAAVEPTGLSAEANFNVQTQWTGLGFDAARSGYNGYENVLNAERAPGLSLALSLPVGSVRGSPAFSRGRMYFGADDGVFRAATVSGVAWSFTTGGPIASSPALFGNPCQAIVFGSDDGKLYGLSCDGSLKWTFTSGGPVRSSPLIVSGNSTPIGRRPIVYFGSGDHSLYAVDLFTGGMVWSAAFGGAVDGSPSFIAEAGANGMVVIAGSSDGTVRAFKADTGMPLWNSSVGGPVSGSVALSAAGPSMPCQAFVAVGPAVGSTTGAVAALNCETGANTGIGTWTHPLDTSPAASPGLMPQTGDPLSNGFKVLVGGANGSLYALERETGAQVWSTPTGGGPILSGPTLTDGLAYVSTAPPVGGTTGELKILSGDGNVLGSLPLSGGTPTAAPAAIVANGALLVSSSDGLNAFTLQSTWPQFHYDATNSGYNPYEWMANIHNSAKRWTFNSGSLMFSPTTANGLVYVGSSNGNVYALNAATGLFKWLYSTGDWVVGAPAVAGNVVYAGSKDGTLYALNAFTGALLWSFTTDGPISAPATVKNGVVYFGSEDHSLYALNASNGTLIWSFASGDKIFGAPAVVNNVVYFGSLDHNVYALSAADASVVWIRTTGGGVASSPAVVGGVVYVGSYDNYMYALQASSGGIVWQFATGGWIFSSPAVAYGKVYFGSTDQNAYAVDLNGNQVWVVHTGSWVLSSPAVANGMVAFGSYDGNLYVADAATGIGCQGTFWGPPVCWGSSFGAGGAVYGSPAIGYGKIYAGSFGNRVIAVGV